MQARLIASGVRPINNVVDITNFVLMEMGQPLHAFDADELGNTIVVRNAYAGEKITTLDGIERVLEETDVLITDGEKPVCLAGVMGGLESEVTDKTVNITLEAAEFAPLAVRKTSSRLGLKSESSVRFERKIDSLRVKRALDYAAQLMCELCDASISSGVKSAYTKDYVDQVVEITADKVNRVLGTSLTDSEVNEIFDRLAYTYVKEDLVYKIVLPSRRMDLEPSVQDIIEDVARMYGYDNIPTTIAKTRDKGALTYKQRRVRLIRQILANMGLNETVTYSLIAEKNLYLYTLEDKEPIKVLMPMTEDRAVMRESLLNGVVDAVQYNKARKLDNLAFFEIGNVYSTEKEELKLAGAMSGLFTSHLWNGVKQEASFYAAKGVLDALFAKINVSVTYKPYKEQKSFHPGRCAGIYMNDKLIGLLGEIHPRLAKELGVGRTIAYELSLEDIVNEVKEFKYQPINKFPSVTRDLAIVVKKDVLCEDVLSVVRQTARKYLTSLELFDVYTGDGVEADEKSLAFKMTFEDSTKTLETQDVDKVIKSILNRLDFNFKARLR
jgi:phenylalanyl-tRNA synthetase beta chain